ncbi:unnamed protein product [Rotaria magnacalcarata]|uniref:Uncharacterized protein n=2 Tax=Rotaria magnacalcarata TaxID=392030 RepID=A0A816R2X0_9BILA|nr:unnamed protein product [Rotaria magnacalcarata]
MADSFDPLKNVASKEAEGSLQQVDKNTSNVVNARSRSAVSNTWTRQSSNGSSEQGNSSGAQYYQVTSNRSANLSSNANKIPRRENYPYSVNTRQSPTVGSVHQPQQVKIVEPKTQPYWETRDDSFEDYAQYSAEGYEGDEYVDDEEEQAYSYQDEYHEQSHKKKGLSAKIDRLVQRFPALGKFYKQPPSSPVTHASGENFQYDQMAGSIGSNPFKYELTADDLALKERYSDKTRTKSIKLQAKDQTQPVDVSINHEKNLIYLCDVGRSIVEIFDMNGTFEHSLSDAIMSKFQPTAIAVSCDGTIITASHFSHCLHMNSPDGASVYSYRRFKLGTEGSQIHQFFHPAGIAIDMNDGYLYVCDRGNNRIQVISPDGLCERVIELFLYGVKNYPLEPIRIAHQKIAGQIVCITGAGDVMCFIPKDADGPIYVTPLVITDTNGLGVENASGLAVDTHDRIFISDTGHHRIVICTPDGSYLTSFGTEGDQAGQLKRPCGLDIKIDGTVIVTDPGNKRIQFFGLIPDEAHPESNPSDSNASLNNNRLIDNEHDPITNL